MPFIHGEEPEEGSGCCLILVISYTNGLRLKSQEVSWES